MSGENAVRVMFLSIWLGMEINSCLMISSVIGSKVVLMVGCVFNSQK